MPRRKKRSLGDMLGKEVVDLDRIGPSVVGAML
jgi:hypothetical protein